MCVVVYVLDHQRIMKYGHVEYERDIEGGTGRSQGLLALYRYGNSNDLSLV